MVIQRIIYIYLYSPVIYGKSNSTSPQFIHDNYNIPSHSFIYPNSETSNIG